MRNMATIHIEDGLHKRLKVFAAHKKLPLARVVHMILNGFVEAENFETDYAEYFDEEFKNAKKDL